MTALLLIACNQQDAPWGELSDALHPGDPHVLVVVLDGVRVEELTSTWTSDLTGTSGEDHAPNLWSDVFAQGTVVRVSQSPVLTSTSPGHATLVTGRSEPIFTVAVEDGNPGLYYPQVPTLFDEARLQRDWEEQDTVLLANSTVMPTAVGSIFPGRAQLRGRWAMLEGAGGDVEQDDTRLLSELRTLLSEGPPPLLVVNVHDADRKGHAYTDYAGAVQEQDTQVASLWRWLENSEPAYLDNLLLILTTDHGRHRYEGEDDSWISHGDACSGCREQPLVLVGGGVEAGRVIADGFALWDVAPTVAAHMDLELPWAQGLPLSTLADSANVPGRSGEVDVRVSGGSVASRRWLDDFEARSEVWVDGERLSTPGIFAAESPSILAGTTALVTCWREYDYVEQDGWLPWRPRCFADTGAGWTDIGFPEEVVGPFFEASLVEADGTIWAAWLSTPLARHENGETDGVRLASWTSDSGWSEPSGLDVYMTTVDVAVAATTRGFLVTAGTSLGDPYGPYSRRAATWRFSSTGRVLEAGEEFQLDELLSDPLRVERPAVRAEGDHVQLAMIGIDEDYRAVFLVESYDGGDTWSEPSPVGEGELFVHLTPRWDGEALVYGALVDDSAALCRVIPGDTPVCIGSDSERIDSFGVVDGVATVSRDAGIGEWELVQLAW